MSLESKRKISKCVISEIVHFAANIASASLRKHNIVDDQVASIIQTFGSEHKRSKFYEENFSFFKPKEIVLGLYPQVVHGNRMMIQKWQNTCYIVPFIDSLHCVLELKEMQKFLTRPVVRNDGIMRNCTDGDYYRKDDGFFSSNYRNDRHKIGIILNLDDVCLVNPLGVRAKTYKYCMIYYTIAEIPQEYRSKLSSIFLLACVKTNYVKKYGLRKILEDFIMGMKELENPRIFINNLGLVRGRLLFTTKDNPVAGLLSGTKESAGLSKRICHTCLIINEYVKRKYKLDPAERQRQAEHLRRCRLIEQATTKTEKSRLRLY